MINFEFTLPFGDGVTPNKNGRIYTKESVEKIVDKIKEGPIPITYQKTEFNPNKPVDLHDTLGHVIDSKYDESTNKIEITCNMFSEEAMKFIEHGFKVVPNGIGDINEAKEVVNYELKFFSITPNSAFED